MLFVAVEDEDPDSELRSTGGLLADGTGGTEEVGEKSTGGSGVRARRRNY